MTDNYHTPYENTTTKYKATDMDAPLGELDEAIGDLHEWADPYLIFNYFGAKPASDEIVLVHMSADVPFYLPAGLVNSQAKAQDTATAQTILAIKRNGIQIGTITFGAGSGVGSFSMGSSWHFQAGDELSVVAPNPMDATLGRIAITIKGIKGQTTVCTTTTTTTTSSSTTTTTTTTTAP